MAGYRASRPTTRRRRVPRRVWYLLGILLLIGVVGSLLVRHKYDQALLPVNRNTTSSIFVVSSGDTVKTIATNLEKAHLIKSAWALQLYVHSKELGGQLQAGTYALSPSEGTKQIVTTLTKGQVSTRLVTILPGRRIDQVRADLINDGFSPTEVDQALMPAQYAGLPTLSFKPANVNTLEGLLWPDSFQKDDSTTVSDIIRESLRETAAHLGSDVQAAFASQNLTTYQGLTLASIIAQEDDNPADQPQVAQVFLSRLKLGMMLGSDVTANYGAIAAGLQPSLTYDSAYNTRLHTGLPPTPISTVTASSLAAATQPASTNWLYFVAGDDGTTHFSTTLQEHEALTQKYCHKLCSQ